MTAHSPACRHRVHFYLDEASVRDAVAAFVAGALRAGEPALVIARPALLQQLRIELHRQHVQGIPFGAARGELVVLDAEETLGLVCIDGKPDEARFAQVVGGALGELGHQHGHVAAYGEMVGILCERGQYVEAVRLERMWNALLAGSRASLYCGYARTLFEAPESQPFFEDIRAAHATVHDDSVALPA